MRTRYDRRALKRIAVAQGYTMTTLAAAARMQRQNIASLWRGITEPRAKTLARLATVLAVPVESFFIVQQQDDHAA